MKSEKPSLPSTSTGHAMSHAAQLDAHFAFAQSEYEAALRSVGIESGWHVLDGGCGNGSFLPLMSSLVGRKGRITAIDVAPEHIETVKSLVEAGKFACPIGTKVGSLTALPFADNTFDAVWCANVSQYMTDEEFEATLVEFKRTVKPGGLVAVKEFDITSWQFKPFHSTSIWHLMGAGLRANVVQAVGVFRPLEFASWFRKNGFTEVRQKTTLTERCAPLNPFERTYLGSFFTIFAQAAEMAPFSVKELEEWQRLCDIESPTHITNHPDFYYREGHVVAIGRVPEH